MDKKLFFKLWLVRAAIVVFWCGLFYGMLLLPRLSLLFEKQRSICMYTWSDRIDEDLLSKFEEETGIKVYMNYYDSNEELITKLEIMPKVDCDIMLPSDYIIEDLIRSKLLKKIDYSRCPFVVNLYPELMSKFYDPQNEYSIPLYWDVMVLGYSKKIFPYGLPENSWSMLFDKNKIPCKQVGMINDQRELLCLTLKYFDLEQEKHNPAIIERMKNVLIQQRSRVGAYCDAQQGYYLSSGAYSLVVSQREYICRAMQDSSDIACIVPKEGSLLTIDNVVISASTKKDDLVYEFLNFLYSYDVLLHNANEFCFLPAHKDAFENMNVKSIGIEGLNPALLEEQNITVFRNPLDLDAANKFWVKVKSS